MEQKLKLIVDSVRPFRSQIATVRDVRQCLVARVIAALGYDTSNRDEVVTGYRSEWMDRKESIDFAILRDGSPAILVECRAPVRPLGRRSSVLGHCFSHSGAKVAVLTDGWIYRVFADHDARGLLDTRSFASFAIDAPDDEAIRVLGLLSREGFDHDAIRALAALRLASKGSLGMGGRPLRGSPQSERFVVAMRGQFRDQVESLRMLIRKHKGVDLCDLNRVVQWAIEDSLKRLAEQKPTEPR